MSPSVPSPCSSVLWDSKIVESNGRNLLSPGGRIGEVWYLPESNRTEPSVQVMNLVSDVGPLPNDMVLTRPKPVPWVQCALTTVTPQDTNHQGNLSVPRPLDVRGFGTKYTLPGKMVFFFFFCLFLPSSLRPVCCDCYNSDVCKGKDKRGTEDVLDPLDTNTNTRHLWPRQSWTISTPISKLLVLKPESVQTLV